HYGGATGMSSMARVSEQQVLDALRRVEDPDRGGDVVSLGMIAGLGVRDGNVGFAVEVAPARGAEMEPRRRACKEGGRAVRGVLAVTAVLTWQGAAPAARPQAGARPPAAPPGREGAGRMALPGVRSVIAGASGKGGVGKSTVAVN